jgi:hypothetical protein
VILGILLPLLHLWLVKVQVELYSTVFFRLFLQQTLYFFQKWMKKQSTHHPLHTLNHKLPFLFISNKNSGNALFPCDMYCFIPVLVSPQFEGKISTSSSKPMTRSSSKNTKTIFFFQYPIINFFNYLF